MLAGNYCNILPLISIFFVGGILNSLLVKLMLIEKSKNSKGEIADFTKPYFITTLQYIGMATSIFYYIIRCYRNRNNFTNILKVITLKEFFCYAIPAFADVFQGIISTITVEFVGVSIDCMMKGGTLIGVTVISQFVFKNHVFNYQWFSVGLIALSLVIIGLSSVINSNKTDIIKVDKCWDIIIIVLKLISQFVYSIKISYEEYLTKKVNHDEALITGIEGIWATLFSFILVFISNFMPGKEGNGLSENFKDTLVMIGNSTLLKILIPILIALSLIYNINSVILISKTSGVTRTLAETFRNFIIWIIQIIIYYLFANSTNLIKYKGIGEQWLDGSYLQFFGYLIMFFGIIEHHGFPKLPFFDYDESKDSGISDLSEDLVSE